MFSLKFAVFLSCCLIVVTASPIEQKDHPDSEIVIPDPFETETLSRHIRSPGRGSVKIDYTKDQRGREASVQYNHNLYKSKNGRGSVEAYAQGSRNFDHNRNNYGGGIQGKWRF